MKAIKLYFLTIAVVVFLACTNDGKQSAESKSAKKIEQRVVSLNGTLTELVCVLGMDSLLVGVDVTSTYPNNIQQLPKLGHTRNLNVEAILALEPTVILSIEGELNPDQLNQLEKTGAKVHAIKHLANPNDYQKTIEQVCDIFNMSVESEKIIENINNELKELSILKPQPKVIFIYARGAGTLMVGGKGTAMTEMIELAGGKMPLNFEGFKPLSPEFLLEANPDAFLLFDSGLKSLEGIEGLKQIPGVAESKAGKHNQIITMDGQLLSGFGPRLGNAAKHLNQQFKDLLVE